MIAYDDHADRLQTTLRSIAPMFRWNVLRAQDVRERYNSDDLIVRQWLQIEARSGEWTIEQKISIQALELYRADYIQVVKLIMQPIVRQFDVAEGYRDPK